MPITISIDGELLNAQHRLSAVIMSKTTQPFLIAWGYAKASAQIYDTGKKRSMDERITVGGTKITMKECAIVRHAMNNWSTNEHGTIEFAQPRHDQLVKEIYLKHKEFLYYTNAHKPAGPAFYHAAALKMYAEMIHFSKHHNYQHDQTPIERAQLFIDVCNHGYSLKGIPVGVTESAAFKLRILREKRQQDKKSPTRYWADKLALQLTITAAYKFMTGEHVEFLRKPERDPFNNFLKMPTTNRLHESQVKLAYLISPMKNVQIVLDQGRADKLKKISEATKGNMTNVSVAGEFIEFEQPKLSSSKLAQALLNSAIDRAFSQLPQQ